MRLRAGERCPIHHSYYCCNRQKTKPTFKQKSQAVTRTPDGRVLCSRSELRRRLLKCLEKQAGLCGICGEPINDIQDAQLDHIEPRGMGGAFRNDDWSNIRATHERCNMAKGSIRNYEPDRKLAASGERDE